MNRIVSRHRLPTRYRLGLTLLWLTPIVLLLLTLILGAGLTLTLFDPRLLVLLVVMALPAVYVWREGVDVLPEGLITRIHWPHYYAYKMLDNWYYDGRADRRVLTIWGQDGDRVFQCQRGHLTDWPVLLGALKANLRYRNWPT